ncbi:hypothetical protein A7K93_01315 [Candidatus Methylacidiphilum fumarolicum]|uniref:Zinc ribbon domain-containing protein n=2 Tax=Candidatus Methylacidiphilum fumarolicum TaxID=591154 RepID=I0JWF1_METFB|nr:hypothetical protein [Candidatus Methylacidiphilum fumarolicum]MBW6415604.1 zinc ribbon domain-containing protein [Candidatus Methylacidiphilum fumarolicum]TFE66631.1 hypothetical protein A7K73_10225 [Candidatus Methylacidiphilum fumarolicum]TFE73377.1 hypothetical protein A7K72_06870 [Candidatus Methylacidiphilum fumarolicum]TFE75424.1 hypothetical protein A7K93_01315 [Candidatus Methylacidiphilum fumarolicum]TFE76643.1 hypothetical protein A7D33_08860 [Candidatus Methylacidiphilum fumarol
MITYVYETIPTKEGEEIKRYEIEQSIADKPLTHHPETGEPIQRIISGGLGVLTSAKKSSVSSSSHPSSSCGCGGGCGCSH